MRLIVSATVFDPKTGDISFQDKLLTDPTQHMGKYTEVPRFELVPTTGQDFVVDVIYSNGWEKHGWNQDGEIQYVGLNPVYENAGQSLEWRSPQDPELRITISQPTWRFNGEDLFVANWEYLSDGNAVATYLRYDQNNARFLPVILIQRLVVLSLRRLKLAPLTI